MQHPPRCLVISLCLLSLALFCVRTTGAEFTSPDGAVRFQLATDAAGQLVYSVAAQGQPRLLRARAGIVVNDRDLGAGVDLGPATTRRIAETFPWRGNKTLATNQCHASEIAMRPRQGGPEWTLEVRVFDDGVGFRYRVSGSGPQRVNGEPTAWQLPPDSTLWLQTNTSDYEGNYHSVRADQVPVESKAGNQTRPTHIGPPMTVVYPDNTFGLISEAALYQYSGLTLRPEGEARFRAGVHPGTTPQEHHTRISNGECRDLQLAVPLLAG